MLGILPKVGKIAKVAVNKSPNPYTISFQVIFACLILEIQK
jgi:hypothetical protein